MIHLFDVTNGTVVPSEHTYTIKEFEAIHKKFKGMPKVFAYIFYMSYEGEQNPYFNIEQNERQAYILKDLGLEIDVNCKEIKEAIAKAVKLYETPTKRLYNTMRIAVDKISKYMEETALSGGRDGNFDEFIKATTNFEKIATSYEKQLEKLKKEESIKTRGNIKVGYDQ